MYNGLLHFHSGLRWIALIALVIAVVSAFMRWKNGSGFGVKGKLLNLITLASIHLQLVIGLLLYFVSPKVQLSGMFDNAIVRFYTLEHFVMMIIAIALITIGYSKVKKASKDKKKNRLTFIFFGIGLLIILIAIPWPFRENLGAGWF